ncbi:MAG: response regulator [Clostridia bacterium]|nr:response regulator [Clostridia bacterium]
MKTIMVDDELWSLNQFKRECENNENIELVGTFDDPNEALEYAKDNRIEFALLDIEMPEMDGLTLGKKLREIYPDLIVVYITAYSRYAIDAMKQKADYFVMKPYSLEDIEDALQRAELLSRRQKKRVFIRTFPAFDVFVDNKAVVFGSPKAKELLALLVDKNGGVVTTEEAFATIWEDKPYSDANFSLCRKAFKRLISILEEKGISNIVLTKGRGKMINKDEIDCDYFAILAGDKKASVDFNGEYMSEYSWAEETNAKLCRITGLYD